MVSATAMPMITHSTGQNQCGIGRISSPTPRVWVTVLSLPPLLAATTWSTPTSRHTVIPTSRTRITSVTHTYSSPTTDREINPAAINALSAIGSAILPKSVTRPSRRAR